MKLELIWRDREVDPPITARVGLLRRSEVIGTQTERRFLDFVVDGESLYDRGTGDNVGCLGWLDSEEDELTAKRLLLDAPSDFDGRVGLFICPECADPHCGAVTALIERQGDDIVWRDFATSDPSWNDPPAPEWIHRTHDSADWPEFRFDAEQYRSAIEGRPKPVV